MRAQLNLGSGPDYRAGWVNVDIDPSVRADLRLDVRDYAGLTQALAEHSIACIYMKHVLEHLEMAHIDPHLAWCARTLQSGGQLVIDGPDLRAMCFRLAMLPEWTWEDVAMIYGGQESPWDLHRSGWSPEFLSHRLRRAGFIDVVVQRVDLCMIVSAVRP